MFILALGFARPSQAAIHCIGKSSGIVAIEHSFEIPESSRMKVFDLDQSAVYLTHKKEFYSLEMFMPTIEQRAYSEGMMAAKQPLTLAIWTRDQLLEVSCVTTQVQ